MFEFEWDSEKELENIRDHGVNFTDASRVLYDYARIAEPFERRIYHGNSETHGWTRVNP